jgi:hypothetical protein
MARGTYAERLASRRYKLGSTGYTLMSVEDQCGDCGGEIGGK